MLNRFRTVTSTVLGLVVAASFPLTALAAFDQNKVLEDDAFTNTSSMSATKIQQFLDDRKSVLGKFSENGRSAAGIIYDAGQAYGINPQVLLANLQKEQGLLTLTNYDAAADPSNRMKTAMGFACPDSGGCDPKYAGFTNQVNGASGQFRYNFDGSTIKKFTDYQVNQTMTFDGTAVTLTNRATASLYRYTPHITGNRSFFNTFFTYFLDYASHWAGQNGFPTLAPGDSYKFSLKFENTGNKTWTNDIVHLGTDNPKDRISPFLLQNTTGNGEDTMWSKFNRVGLAQNSVGPGSFGDFNFYMAVPTTMKPGTYKEYFRPVADGVQWLDDDHTYWDVNVVNHQAKWGGQNFGIQTVEAGQSFKLEVKLQNSGQTTWRNFGNTPVRLGTSRPADRVTNFIREDQTDHNPSGWATANRVSMVESTVAPGGTGTFAFWYTVPAGMKPGVYREYFQPIHDNVGWMNDLGLYFDITVRPQQATFANQSGYPSLAKGESAQFTVNYTNTGTTTWTKAGANPMQLAAIRPTDRTPLFIRDDANGHNPSGWINPNRVSMVQNTVAPGGTGTFTFWYTVPSDKPAGTYKEYFGLVQEGVGSLPDNGLYWDVTVR